MHGSYNEYVIVRGVILLPIPNEGMGVLGPG